MRSISCNTTVDGQADEDGGDGSSARQSSKGKSTRGGTSKSSKSKPNTQANTRTRKPRVATPLDRMLEMCGQTIPVGWGDVLGEDVMDSVFKLGEGSFAEVRACLPSLKTLSITSVLVRV